MEPETAARETTRPARVPKILGADVEFGNFIDGLEIPSGSGGVASRLLLSAIEGIPAGATDPGRWSGSPSTPASGPWPAHWPRPAIAEDEDDTAGDGRYVSTAQDWGRRFLPGSGGCAYIDLSHLELALPETFSAFDHVAYWRAMLEIARTAVTRVNDRLTAGRRVHALANCSDGHGHSYGAHVNVLLTRAAWDTIIRRKPHVLAYLAAFQVSSLVFTGAGKVGSENGQPWADYQLSQRADFIETSLGEQTTFNRPLVNARDEALCGPLVRPVDGADSPELARLHVIFFDATLCQVATLLRVGTLQIVIAMIEAGVVATGLALDDPLDALQRWSRDLSCSVRARLVAGGETTAVGLQERFLDQARRFADSHGFDGIVPRAAEILDLWEDTLRRLREGDFDTLSRRLDWVLKRQILERAMASRPSLTWASPEIRHLDQLYASVDDAEGLFWASEQAGLVDVVVGEDEIRRAVHEPPDDTRAWTRTHLLRRAGARRIQEVDWDRVGVRLDVRRHLLRSSPPRSVLLPCPFGATRADREALFAAGRTLEDIVADLQPETPATLAAAVPSTYTVC